MASTLFTPQQTVIKSSWLNDVDTGTYLYLTNPAGTNAITAGGPLGMTAYVAGQRFFLVPLNTNTGAVTLNVKGLGALPITKYGSAALIAGDLIPGAAALLFYDGTELQLLNPQTLTIPSTITGTLPIANGGTGATTATAALLNLGATGRLLNVQSFTASGTYTPTTGTTSIIVQAVGGGGGGGGAVATGAAQVSVGGGGGPGAYVMSRLAWTTTAAVVVGTGGSGTTGAGGTGNDTTFNSTTVIAKGAAGGVAGVLAGGLVATSAGGTQAGSVGNLSIITGSGLNGWAFVLSGSTFAVGGMGGASGFSGTTGIITNGGGAQGGSGGRSYGGGGSGGTSVVSSSSAAGGGGAAGIMIIYEYA